MSGQADVMSYPMPPCRSRAYVLGWCRRGREAGTRARVTEALVPVTRSQ